MYQEINKYNTLTYNNETGRICQITYGICCVKKSEGNESFV
jgi:hypothetical protein